MNNNTIAKARAWQALHERAREAGVECLDTEWQAKVITTAFTALTGMSTVPSKAVSSPQSPRR